MKLYILLIKRLPAALITISADASTTKVLEYNFQFS